MVRLPGSGRYKTVQRPMEDQQASSSTSGRLGRKLFLVLGIGALVYLLVRRRDRDDSTLEQRVADTLKSDESDDGGLEGAQRIEIGEPSPETDRTVGPDSAVGATSVSRTERSDAEIDERVEPDVQEEPAEPGEMSIDEDIATEVTDGESDQLDERKGGDESAVEPNKAAETDDTSETEQEAETGDAADTDEEDGSAETDG